MSTGSTRMSTGSTRGRAGSLTTASAARLRPHPHRGDVIAAGAVPLALFALVVDLRMVQWSLGARFTVVALIGALLFTMGWLTELESATPRAYHSVLLVAGLLVMIVALRLLAQVLGAERSPGAGAVAWTFAAEALLAAAAARRANSGACTLIAALAAAVACQGLVQWVFTPHGSGTFRAILLVLTLAFAAGAVRLRDHRRRHAVQLVNAAAIMSLVLGASFLLGGLLRVALSPSSLVTFGGTSGAGFGWELWILAVAFGLIAYAAADQEPAPAYFGVALLVEFAFLAATPRAGRASLVGWPLFLLVIGAAGLTIGMRPRRELPPPPAGASPAPTVPLTREDHDRS